MAQGVGRWFLCALQATVGQPDHTGAQWSRPRPWRRWVVNRNDVITAHGLDALMDNQLMPTLEVIGERFPKLSSAERQEMLVSSSKQYLSENTKLYFLVKDSVDISGAYEQLDTDYINKSFVGAAGSRSLRDGLGFLNWVESFFDITKDDAQISRFITPPRLAAEADRLACRWLAPRGSVPANSRCRRAAPLAVESSIAVCPTREKMKGGEDK